MTDIQKQSGWVGWAVFGGIVLIIAGVFDALFGLAALIGPSSAYFLTTEGDLWLVDVTGWGWWHLILGLAMAAVGVFVLRGASWARITAVVLVSVNAVSQLAHAARVALVGAHRDRARHPRDLRAHRPRQGTRRPLSPLPSHRGAASFGVRRPFSTAEPSCRTPSSTRSPSLRGP